VITGYPVCFSTFRKLSLLNPIIHKTAIGTLAPPCPSIVAFVWRAPTFEDGQRENLEMPFFECKVARTVLTDDLQARRVKESVYVEAKDEMEAKKKAGHPLNWLRSGMTFGKSDKSSFLLTVEECRRLANDEIQACGLREAVLLHAKRSAAITSTL
jgi:hypothetical protein